ncbi:hypothetical protein L3X07_05690 [Levilactobacillus brevis]|nr:hypothetical protein [Levilactobacillus brevis]
MQFQADIINTPVRRAPMKRRRRWGRQSWPDWLSVFGRT